MVLPVWLFRVVCRAEWNRDVGISNCAMIQIDVCIADFFITRNGAMTVIVSQARAKSIRLASERPGK